MAAKKLTQEEIDQLKKDLLEIEDLSEKLGQNIDISKYRDIVKSADEIKTLVKALRVEWKDITGDISIAAEGFRNSVSRINDQNSGLKASARAYKGLISLADELQNYQRGWANLSEKDIARIKERSSLERIRLEENQKVLETEKTSTKLNVEALDKQISRLYDIMAAREKDGKSNTKNLEIYESKQKLLKKEEEKLKKITHVLEQNEKVIKGNDESFKNLNLTINETLRQIKQDFVADLDKRFKNIVYEIQTTEDSIKKVSKSFEVLTHLAQKIQDHQSGTSKLSEKELKTILEKAEVEKKRSLKTKEYLNIENEILLKNKKDQEEKQKLVTFELNQEEKKIKKYKEGSTKYSETLEKIKKLKEEEIEISENQKNITNEINLNQKTQDKITENLEKQNGTYEELVKKAKQIQIEQETVRKTLGLSGALIDGLSDSLNKIGFGGLAKIMGIDEAKEKMQSLAEEISKSQAEEINIRKKVEETKQELAAKSYDQVLTKLNREKQLEEEIAATRGLLSDKQLKIGVGGIVLKQKQLELEALKTSITEEDKALHKKAEINKLDEEHVNNLHQHNAQYKGINGQVSVLKKGLHVMGSNLVNNLKDPLSLALALVGQMVLALTEADKATGELAKRANMTYDAASSLRQEFGRISELSMDSAVTIKGLQESYLAISENIGAQVDMNAANLELMTKLRERAGVTNETYGSMLNYAAATGQEIQGTISGFLGGAKALGLQANKVINVKQLLAETSKTSNAIKLSIVGGAEALGRAAAQAKMLGMTLSQVDKIAGSLLQFEDSISAELSAELLTGKELNLETARYAALTGNVEVLSQEIAKNIGSAADFTNMNRIQQEALAKAVGMTREELADTLVEQEAFNKLGQKLTDEEKAAYEFAKEKYGLQRAVKMVGEGELDNLMKQQSIQDRFNQSVEKLKEIFVSIADPILKIVSPLADLVTTILPAINLLLSPLVEGFRLISEFVAEFVEGLKEGNPAALTLGAALLIVSRRAIALAIGSIFSAFSALGPFGIPLAVTAVAGLASLMRKSESEVKDAEISRKTGEVQLSSDYGTVILDKKDKVYDPSDPTKPIKVGTDLFGEKKMRKDKMIPSSNTVNNFFKNTSKEKEIANVAQNTFNNISKEKEIIKDIVDNVSANATKEIAKETDTFKISKTKEILSNNKITSGLKDTNVLDKTLSYIDKTNNLKTETLRNNKLNQLASSSIDNLKVSNLISDKQQIEQDREKNNIFSLLNKEKETTTDTAVTNDFLSKTTTLPESTINVTNNSSANKTADSTVNNNIVNSSASDNIKLLRELTQSFQSLLEENKKQNAALNQIARKDSNIYIDSTKAGTANRIGATEVG